MIVPFSLASCFLLSVVAVIDEVVTLFEGILTLADVALGVSVAPVLVGARPFINS